MSVKLPLSVFQDNNAYKDVSAPAFDVVKNVTLVDHNDFSQVTYVFEHISVCSTDWKKKKKIQLPISSTS